MIFMGKKMGHICNSVYSNKAVHLSKSKLGTMSGKLYFYHGKAVLNKIKDLHMAVKRDYWNVIKKCIYNQKMIILFSKKKIHQWHFNNIAHIRSTCQLTQPTRHTFIFHLIASFCTLKNDVIIRLLTLSLILNNVKYFVLFYSL